MIHHVTPTIHLSAIVPADRDDILSHVQDRELSRYTRVVPYPYPPELADQWITSVADDVDRNGRETVWAIRDETKRMIGTIELAPGVRGKEHTSEIGYWLAKTYWGRGIMTSTVRHVVELGFRDFRLERITAHVFLINTASARVLDKNGFIIEAPLLRKEYQRDGQTFDGRLYARLRED
jgi:RimJ/RimL family protein N-acetyltransferase